MRQVYRTWLCMEFTGSSKDSAETLVCIVTATYSDWAFTPKAANSPVYSAALLPGLSRPQSFWLHGSTAFPGGSHPVQRGSFRQDCGRTNSIFSVPNLCLWPAIHGTPPWQRPLSRSYGNKNPLWSLGSARCASISRVSLPDNPPIPYAAAVADHPQVDCPDPSRSESRFRARCIRTRKNPTSPNQT